MKSLLLFISLITVLFTMCIIGQVIADMITMDLIMKLAYIGIPVCGIYVLKK